MLQILKRIRVGNINKAKTHSKYGHMIENHGSLVMLQVSRQISGSTTIKKLIVISIGILL